MTNLLAGLKLFIAFDKELRKMNKAMKEFDKTQYNFKNIINIAHPLGSSYVQYPGCKSPNEYYKGTLWEKRAEKDGLIVWVRIK